MTTSELARAHLRITELQEELQRLRDSLREASREPSQREKDDAALKAWANHRVFTTEDLWHAALAYERAEIVAVAENGLFSAIQVRDATRARCAHSP